MSGPITAGYLLIHGALLLSARALKEARAMKRDFGEVRDALRARTEQLAQARRGQQAARLERLAAARNVEAPVAGTGAADSLRAAKTAQSRGPSIDEVLSAYARQRQARPGLDAAQAEGFRQTAARIIGRLGLPEGAALPAGIEALARDIVLAPTPERAEAIGSELRRAVQRWREALGARRAEGEEARRLLEALSDDAPAPLVAALERVAAEVDRLDDALRAAAQQVLAAQAADQAESEREAAALVLEETLRDLGYEVEGIEATLFAGGGAVHFRRPGWESYFVRLRVDAREQTVNFNVVRAKGAEETAERRRQDALAEDRWCSEFPRLLRTLESRGLRLEVTRRLAAGELPVQVVDAAALPAVPVDEAATPSHPAPLARPQR